MDTFFVVVVEGNSTRIDSDVHGVNGARQRTEEHAARGAAAVAIQRSGEGEFEIHRAGGVSEFTDSEGTKHTIVRDRSAGYCFRKHGEDGAEHVDLATFHLGPDGRVAKLKPVSWRRVAEEYTASLSRSA